MNEVVERKSKWGKVGKVFLILSIVILVVAAAAYSATGLPSGAAAYRQSREDAKRVGLPFREEEILKITAVPDSLNAIDLVRSMKSAPDFGYEKEKIPKAIEKFRPEIEEGMRQLRRFPPRKYIIDRWDVKEELAKEPRWNDVVRSWTKDLAILAGQSAAKNDLPATREYLEYATLLTMGADDDGSMRGCMRRSSGASQIEYEIRRMLPVHAMSEAWLTMMLDILYRLDEPYDIVKILKVEHYRSITLLNEIVETRAWSKVYNDGPSEFSIGASLPRFREANLARIHEFFTLILPHLPSDPFDLPGVQAAVGRGESMLDNWAWSYAFLKYVVPVSPYFVTRLQVETATRYTLLQATTLLLHKSDPAKGLPIKGRYRLDLDGKPIRVKRLSKGWVIYSIGSNGVDDGGIDETDRRPDVVAHLSMGTVPPDPKPKPPQAAPRSP